MVTVPEWWFLSFGWPSYQERLECGDCEDA